MEKLTVSASKIYDVLIGKELLRDIGNYASEVLSTGKICIITDSIVDHLYGKAVSDSLESSGFTVCKFVFPSGEASKNIAVFSAVLEFLAQEKLTRTDAIAALGGGVVGDLAGFAAATYLRGIPFIQIPTTFLAAIDSSVGGKTGINLESGKNLAGAFWQPSLVLCDYQTFQTLPEKEMQSGIAEAIKYGMIEDRELFDLLSTFEKPAELSGESLEQIIATCISIKAAIVASDERDTGRRQLLNFGHTIGHALEKCGNYAICHGHAVAIGMHLMSKIAYKAGWSSGDCTMPLEKVLRQYGFDLSCPYSAADLTSAALQDKKRTGDLLTLVVPHTVGDCRMLKIEIALLEGLIRGVL